MSTRRKREMFEVFRPVSTTGRETPKKVAPEKPQDAVRRVKRARKAADPRNPTIAIGGGDSAGRRTVVLRVEELVGFVAIGLILAAASFLVGWRGGENRRVTLSSVAEASAEEENSAADSAPVLSLELDSELAAPEDAIEAEAEAPTTAQAAPDEGSTSPPQEPQPKFTLEAVRFPGGDHAVARSHARRLESAGYRPVQVVPKRGELAVLVGRFHSQSDPQATRWRAELRRLRKTYSRCEIVPLP